MEKRYTYQDNRELWAAESRAKAMGYEKTSDCYWTQIFSDGANTVVTVREDAQPSTIAEAFQEPQEAQEAHKEPVEEAQEARAPSLHISKENSKLGHIANMSLAPMMSCSREACETCGKNGCYAMKSYRMYKNTRRAWDENTELALYDLDAMEAGLTAFFSGMNAPRFFRIHVGGDFITRDYAEMWIRVAKKASGTRFLAFTKQFDIIRGLDFPENFTLVLSDWPGTTVPEDLRKRYNVAWLDDGTRPAETFPADALECPGHCETCGACWNVGRDTIFHKH